jgi:hypothetical protein
LEKVSFQQFLQVFPSTHHVPFRTGAFGYRQLPGLLGANDHVFPIFRQPFVRGHLSLSQGLLLPRMQFSLTRFSAGRSPLNSKRRSDFLALCGFHFSPEAPKELGAYSLIK